MANISSNQNQINQGAMSSTLQSPSSGTPYTAPAGQKLSFINYLNLTLIMYAIQTDGSLEGFNNSGSQIPGGPAAQIAPNMSVSFTTWTPSSYVLFLTANSGAFVTAYQLPSAPTTVTITVDMLPNPNAIGAPPKPTSEMIIPSDSPSVLVGCGRTAANLLVTREQFWRRMPDSYSIPPTASKTISLTHFSGRQETSSSLTTIAESVGVSVSAGWGPISASVSASLSRTSSSFQQVSITEEVTSYTSDTINNTNSFTLLYLIWQLTDVITIYNNSGEAAASLVTSVPPSLIVSYNLDQLLNPPSSVAVVETLDKKADIRAKLDPERLNLAAPTFIK